MNEPVHLSMREIIQGAFVGIMRHVEKIAIGREDKNGAETQDQWQIDVEGALGEMALAKWLGVFWTGANQFREVDVGDYEVRTTKYATGKLILKPTDCDESPFVLVTGADGTYRVRGWISGVDGKRQTWWGDPGTGRPAFFVPQSELHPLEKVG